MLYAYLNAANETGFGNPIDDAIRRSPVADAEGWEKLDEIPYDFLRKRLSVLVQKDAQRLLITKGALRQMLEVCGASANRVTARLSRSMRFARKSNGTGEQFSSEGHRVLGVAYREMPTRTAVTRDDENEMTFAGFVVLSDPPKAGIACHDQ